MVLFSALRGFSPGTPVFPSPQKPTLDLICVNLLISFSNVPKASFVYSYVQTRLMGQCILDVLLCSMSIFTSCAVF